MSKYRVKGTAEVNSARSKLDGVLQTLVEKKEDGSLWDTSLTEVVEEPTVVATPTKKSASKPSRKRKRGRDEPIGQEMGQYHHTYVMKLFDRSVDLAQFEETSALYPICRAWMRNQPHNRNLGPRERSPTPEREDDLADEYDSLDDVYRLPPPIPIKSETDSYTAVRVPSPLPPPESDTPVLCDEDIAPSPENLLLNHMLRWKTIRQRWRVAARRSEALYSDSMGILKEMFDRQCKDQ